MKINKNGLDLIKAFEGCKLKAYQDIVGVWTIGYGHTGADVTPSLVWTQEQADEELEKDLVRFEKGVLALIKRTLTPNQFAAVVSFAFNLGLGNLGKSTLLRCIAKGNMSDASCEFVKWNKAGGKVVGGLTRRRLAEKALFLKE